MAQDALPELALTGPRTSQLGPAPRDEVHLAANVIRYFVAEPSEPIPVDVPNEQHIDVAPDGIEA